MLYFQSAAGFALLFAGGELLVRGAVAAARRFGISPLLIGMTIVAAATSSPELVVSLEAALAGQPDIAIGNVVGSNIANVLLILGFSALITPILIDPRSIRRDGLVALGAAAALLLIISDGSIARAEGVALVVALVAYGVLSYWLETRRGASSADVHLGEAEEFGEWPRTLPLALGALVLGLGILLVGAQLLIAGATGLARQWGVPEAVIGLTIVAVGTSLPELATSIAAAARGHSDVAVGNVLGSNVFNTLGILGITAMTRPVPVAAQIVAVDGPLALGAILLVLPFLLVRGRLGRRGAALLLVCYVTYAAWRYMG